jgi:DNA-binding Lrp family transcriptional regulator
LKANPNVQLAFMARGSYDLFIFFLAKDPLEAEQLIYEIRKSSVLATCTAEWFSSYYTQGIGFIPVRDEFFQTLEKRVWHRSKEHPRKEKDQIFMREYATLRELNNDGLITFTEIDRRYGLKEGSALYTYQQLLKNEMIFRTTITMQNPPIKDTVVFIAKQLDVKRFIEHRKEWLANVLSDGEGPLNKYIFEGDIGSPYGLIHIAPTYKDCNIESIEQNLYASVKGIKIETSIITKFLVGTFSYRKFDMKKSILYKINKQEIE